MANHYYIEYGGGLGDIFQQIYVHGTYSALNDLGDDERATVTLISHNPFAPEIFVNHPRKDRILVEAPGYWLPEDDGTNRRRLNLPPFSRTVYSAGPVPRHDGVIFYPTEADAETLRRLAQDPRVGDRPIVVFSVSAGEPYKSLPAALVPRLVADVAKAGCVPVFVGRSYERNFREELKGAWTDEGIDLIDALTVPGTARLVQQAVAVVCCHSSINMLAAMEHKPQLILYPQKVFDEFIRPRTQWAAGIDHAETVHGRFEDYDAALMERFLVRVAATARKPVGLTSAAARPGDVRDFLQTLPVTRNPATGEDYTKADWFTAWNGYPFYARAAEIIHPRSVLEIGAFLGFGLAAFVHGEPGIERLTAADNESYIPGSRAACAENLAFFSGQKRFVASVEAARGPYDLIHVDADHSFDGALDDVAFAWGLGPRVMLVDDYSFLGDVRRAVETFASHHSLPFKVWKSYRGWAVFAEPDAFRSLPDEL